MLLDDELFIVTVFLSVYSSICGRAWQPPHVGPDESMLRLRGTRQGCHVRHRHGSMYNVIEILLSLIAMYVIYCQTLNIRHQIQHINVSRLVVQLKVPNPLKPGVKSRM